MDCVTSLSLLSLLGLITSGAVFGASADTNDGQRDCKGGDCDLYEQSGYRLQFLGGYHDNSEAFFEFEFEEEEYDNNNEMVCYQYKLHEYLHKQGLKQIENEDDKITVSMQVCPSNNHNNNNGGAPVVSDYLRKVNIYNENDNVDNNDTYYVDDTHFYYVSYPGNGNQNNNENHDNNNNTIIELCFSPGEENDDFTHNAKIVTETEYCIQHNNENKLCSKRGIYMTDICGLDSIHQKYDLNQPAAKIDYVPKPGQLYHVHKSGDMHSLTKGHGYFEINSYLVVVRGWWIDSCIMNDDETEVILSLNDDYFEEIQNNNEYIEDFNDLINAPLTLPIYDHFIISSHCHNIHGMITSYKHNSKNETLTLTVDIASEDVSPLMFFNEAKFKIKKMSSLDLHYDEDFPIYDSNNTETVLQLSTEQQQRRRLRRYRHGFTETLSLPFDAISTNYPINVKIKATNYLIGNCTFTITPTASITQGLKIDYKIKWRNLKKSKLEAIYGIIGLEVGLAANATCWFGEQGVSDGKVDVEIFSREYEFGKYKATIGPLVITAQPWVKIGAVLTRPALGVLLQAYASIQSSFYVEAGWDRDDGPFGSLDDSLTTNFIFQDPVFPGSDGRLAAEFAITVTPGLTFGLYSTDLLSVGVPLQLPYINAEIQFGNDVCPTDGDFGVNFEVELGLAVLFEVEIEKIKVFGIKVYDGYTWEPENPLFDITLWNYEKQFGCKEPAEVNSMTIGEKNYTIQTYNDYPFVLVGTQWTFLASQFVSYEDANAYCSLRFGSTLATVDTTDRYNQVFELIDTYTVWGAHPVFYPSYIGLNDLDGDGSWNWEKDDSSYTNTNQWTTDSCTASECQCTFLQIGATSSDPMFRKHYCDTTYGTLTSFVCDLYNITYENDRYIGVYLYDTYLNWDEANDYCDSAYGTELATILYSDDNDNAFNAIWDLMQEHSHVDIAKAWFGLHNVSQSDIYTFKFADGRDSNDTGYTNWKSNSFVSGEHCADLKFTNGNSDKEWRGSDCNAQRNALICNRPNTYKTHSYMDFIGVEAIEYGLGWEEANHVCETEFGTELASIHSSDETEYLNNISYYFKWHLDNTKRPWIGLNDITTDGTYEWVDGTTYSYTNWYPGRPNNDGDCNEALPYYNSEWNDGPCSDKKKYFICNRDITIFEYNDYIGINTHAEDDSEGLLYTWNEAETYCNTHYGTNLASIHSSDQQEDIEYVINEIDAEPAWIGLYDTNNPSDLSWAWQDGSSYSANDAHWYAGGLYTAQPNGGTQDCVYVTVKFDGWGDLHCSNYPQSAFICNRPITTMETDDYIGVNLRNIDSLTWNEANQYCSENYNTTLASVFSDNQYNQTLDIWKAFDNYNTFIGINDIDNDNTYDWIDGNDASYTQWCTSGGQPDNAASCGAIAPLCNGQWRDLSCSNDKESAFICNKPISTYENDKYIGVNTHNSFYNYSAANDYCSNVYGTNLATQINNQDNFEVIEEMMNTFINTHEAWIGADDLTTEGTFEWIDGSGSFTSSDNFWSTNQPDSFGGNQDCVVMWVNFRPNEFVNGFDDNWCSSQFNSFICDHKYQIIRSGNFIGVNMWPASERLTFDESEAYCNEHFGTNLASIHSNEENNEISGILDTFYDKYNYNTWWWIGINDPNSNDNWEWSDNTIVNYTNFATATSQDCAYVADIDSNGNVPWYQVDCINQDRAAFICNA